jgi:hypothetical protein
MLSPEEQKRIIQTNRAAFEALALEWRSCITGDTESDLAQAVLNMVGDYFNVPSIPQARLVISQLTTKDIPRGIRAKLKDLCTGPDSYPDFWLWNDDSREWVLSLRDARENIDAIGEVAIVPLEDEPPFKHHVLPKPKADHKEWSLKFDIYNPPSYPKFPILRIPLKGSLEEAKRQVDLLLGADTPPIP